jgi:hypothetical protein
MLTSVVSKGAICVLTMVFPDSGNFGSVFITFSVILLSAHVLIFLI